MLHSARDAPGKRRVEMHTHIRQGRSRRLVGIGGDSGVASDKLWATRSHDQSFPGCRPPKMLYFKHVDQSDVSAYTCIPAALSLAGSRNPTHSLLTVGGKWAPDAVNLTGEALSEESNTTMPPQVTCDLLVSYASARRKIGACTIEISRMQSQTHKTHTVPAASDWKAAILTSRTVMTLMFLHSTNRISVKMTSTGAKVAWLLITAST